MTTGVPAHLPDAGGFHLRELRGVAVHRSRLVATALGALIGALSHVALDHVTHDWGWLATNVDWYREPIVERTVLGRRWTPYRLAQYTGHVALSAYVVWWLWRNGMERWMAARAAQVPEHRSTIGAVILAVGMVAGIAVSGAWVLADRAGSATDTMRIAAGTFAGLAIGAASVARLASRHQRGAPVDASAPGA